MRLAGILVVGLGCLLSISCALVPGGGERTPVSRGAERVLPSRSAWVGASDVFDAGRTRGEAEEFLLAKRSAGFDSVFLMVRDESGSLAFPREENSTMPFGARDCRNCLDNFILASESTGVAVVAAYPVFLGRPARGEEPIEYAWDSELQRAELRPRVLQEDGIPRRNPSLSRVQGEELVNLMQLARTGVGEICLTHLGFSGGRADFSSDARAGVEMISRRRLPDWPEEVIGFTTSPGGGEPVAMPGPAWGAWMMWRAGLLQRFVQLSRQATAVAASEESFAAPRLHVMATGYYPLHTREGLNWATRTADVRTPWPEAPEDYELTGVGDFVGGVVLESLIPAVSVNDARAMAIEDWASLEGVLLTGTRLLARETERSVLISPTVFEGDSEAFENAERMARQRGWSVVIAE